ncbi:hypothetical protein CRV24_001778 [Beauveria bassiana]|nr:hypothetical protein CRV24_001778 [Beauveria bassiana]
MCVAFCRCDLTSLPSCARKYPKVCHHHRLAPCNIILALLIDGFIMQLFVLAQFFLLCAETQALPISSSRNSLLGRIGMAGVDNLAYQPEIDVASQATPTALV